MATSQAQSDAKKKSPVSDAGGPAQTNGEAQDMFMPIVGTEKLLGGSARAMNQLVAGSQELMRFYSTRMKKNLSFVSTLTACKTPQDFSKACYNAVSSAVHDYADEFDRILAIGLSEPEPDAKMRHRDA
jgi:hypothetical protein